MRITRWMLSNVATALALVVATAAQADDVKIKLRQVSAQGVGEEVGTILFRNSKYGLLVVPDLRGLKPGPHGLHIHENPDCGPATQDSRSMPGGASGGHFDPQRTGRHEGPYGNGHLGDLPVLIVGEDGTANIPVLAPRLKVAAIHGRSVMVHAGADGYEQHGAHAHGTGGARMYCAVIP